MPSPESSAVRAEQDAFLSEHGASIAERLESGKIRFVESGMEFPECVSRALLDVYLKGRSLRRARVALANKDFDFEGLRPHIVPSKTKGEKHFLFCHLTRSTLPRDANVVKKHVSGRRFQRRKQESEERFKERQRITEKRHLRKMKAMENEGKKMEEGEKEVGLESGDEEEEEEMEEMLAEMDRDMLEDVQEEEQDEDRGMQEGDTVNDAAAVANMEDSDSENAHDEGENESDSDSGDNFWTRGRAGMQQESDADDDDEDGEWGSRAGKNARKKKTVKRVQKKGGATGNTEKKPSASASSVSPRNVRDVAKRKMNLKRKRERSGVLKKARRARQKARTATE